MAYETIVVLAAPSFAQLLDATKEVTPERGDETVTNSLLPA